MTSNRPEIEVKVIMILLRAWPDSARLAALAVAGFVGTLWLNALKMTVIPLVIALLVVPGAAGRLLSERSYSYVAHRVFTSPRGVVFRVMEYSLPRAAGLDALRDTLG